MFSKLRRSLAQKLGKSSDTGVEWHRQAPSSWLRTFFETDFLDLPPPPMAARIEDLAHRASMLGDMPLWEGFEQLEDYPFPVKNATRNANQVRVADKIGNLFYNLTVEKKPTRIIEIGSAFGVSGMYWLSGLEANDRGTLLAFEPNTAWAEIADANLATIGSRYVLTADTFEETHQRLLTPNDRVEIAFIDAIHQSAIVNQQYSLVSRYCSPGALVLFDDINFSEDMWDCWQAIANSSDAKASCSVAKRLGILELAE